jgi:hypothetical protein
VHHGVPRAQGGSALKVALVAVAGLGGIIVLDDGGWLYWAIDHLGMPLLRLLPPETAHDVAIRAAAIGCLPKVSATGHRRVLPECRTVSGCVLPEWAWGRSHLGD